MFGPFRGVVTVSRPVGGVLSTGPLRGSGWVAIHLCGPPGDVDRAGRPTLGLAPSGGCRAARVTPDAGALLPHRFTLACAASPGHRRSALCCPIRQVTPSWLSPAPLPCGAPTFLDAVELAPRPPGRLTVGPSLPPRRRHPPASRPSPPSSRHADRAPRRLQRRRHRHPHHDHGARARRAARRRPGTPLRPLVPAFLIYVLSFVYLGIYWNNHHHMLHATDRDQRRDPVGQPAPAVLAVARAVRHRRGWARTTSRRCRPRSTARVLLLAGARVLHPADGSSSASRAATRRWRRALGRRSQGQALAAACTWPASRWPSSTGGSA